MKIRIKNLSCIILALLILVCMCSCSGGEEEKAKCSEQQYRYAKKCIEICDACLDFDITYEEADDKFSAIESSAIGIEADNYEFGSDEWSAGVKLISAESRLLSAFAKFITNDSEAYDCMLEARNLFAEAIGEEKR